MTPAGFEHTVRIHNIEGLKKRITNLKKRYNSIKKKFDVLCDELDNTIINEQYLQEVSTHLTIYLSEMDIIEKKINDIEEILDKITLEISN